MGKIQIDDNADRLCLLFPIKNAKREEKYICRCGKMIMKIERACHIRRGRRWRSRGASLDMG